MDSIIFKIWIRMVKMPMEAEKDMMEYEKYSYWNSNFFNGSPEENML